MERLPAEIQHLLFNYLAVNNRDIKQCLLVCNSWNSIYERLWYSRVQLNDLSNLSKFVATIEQNPQLGKLVKDARLLIYRYSDRTCCEERAMITKFFALASNLERIQCDSTNSYRFLLDAITANQLPRLNHVVGPSRVLEYRDYVACCFLLKDRIKNLSILDGGDEDIKDDDRRSCRESTQPKWLYVMPNPSGQCVRLLESLNQFKNIEELHIRKTSCNIICLMEYVLCQSPSLRKLRVDATSHNGNFSSLNEVMNKECSLVELTISGNISDPKIIDYIVSSFPKLEILDISLATSIYCSNLDDAVYTKLLEYLPKLKRAEVKIPFIPQVMLDIIRLFAEDVSYNYLLDVSFDSSVTPKEPVTLSIRDGVCRSRVSSVMSPEVIEKYRHYIVTMTLKHVDLSKAVPSQLKQKQYDDAKLRKFLDNHPLQEFLDHESKDELLGHNPLQYILDQCVKLKSLTMIDMTLTEDTFPYRDPTKKRDMETLRLLECTLQNDGVFKTLTGLFSSIDSMELRKIKNLNHYSELSVFSGIEMMQTNIRTLTLSRRIYGDEHPLILLSIASKNVETCYYCDLRRSNEDKFKPMGVEYFLQCKKFKSNFYDIGLHFKSLNTLIVEEGYKTKIRLNNNNSV